MIIALYVDCIVSDVVRYLISVCRDKSIVDLSNNTGRTCLHIAAITNNIQLVDCLLQHKPHVNLTMKFKVKHRVLGMGSCMSSNGVVVEKGGPLVAGAVLNRSR